jgi:hypothetical protein
MGWKNGAFLLAHALFVALAVLYVWDTSSILRAGLS